uniref:DUF1648 domain-containing protein n=1 Tax=Candidatus Kentrum sp. SD TaxID=2126332 RepID=A0A450YXF5_9GAMM|nr:MAG: hypothetical protein BECKSD772F_GA0070984_103326 [Candidatus Kentron sp. SD]VFK44654.1 MAG: hypothetical protein BECKSD772E_GA0070983_104123 [Candidatus Kentron sp. SD]VFK46261.1 MAG: hypothetical protein BECKSD772F_GA0070984_12881 [Candidatus Kentron sp. SD]
MRGKLKVAFSCYLLTLPLLMAFGLMYLFRPEFMPYHAVAVGRNWSEVDPGFQILILDLMKVAGGGLLATACAMGILLFKPFRQGARWTYWAIPAIGWTLCLPLLYATVHVARNTPASPPWMAIVLGILLLVAGFLFSMIPEAKTRQGQKD